MTNTRWLSLDEQKTWRAFIMGSTALNDRLDHDLREHFDLSLAEYEILVRLSEHEGRLRMAQLANSMVHSRSRVTHTVSRMESAGWVNRTASETDGRGVIAVLTPEGLALLEKAAHAHVTGVREYFVDLTSKDDFKALGRAMQAVVDKLVSPEDQAAC